VTNKTLKKPKKSGCVYNHGNKLPTCELCRLPLTVNLQNIREEFCSINEMFESIDNYIIIGSIKKIPFCN